MSNSKSPEIKNLEEQYLAAQQHLEQLQHRSQNIETPNLELQSETITALSIALEELSVTLEELQLQNEELLATRTELEEEYQRYQDLFELAPGGYLVTDGNGTIQEANDTAASMLGIVSNKYLVGKPIDIFIYPTDKATFYRRWRDVKLTVTPPGEKHFECWEMNLQSRSGKTFPVSLSVSSTWDNEEILVSQRWLIQDLSEQKQLQAQLFRTQRMETLGTMASGMAHDLNNILTPILGSAQTLQQTLPDLNKPNQKLFGLIETSTQRGADLLKKLLLFSRGIEGEKVVLSVKILIDELKPLLEAAFPKSIEIEINIAKNLWQICGDVTQLHQMLMNLCLNARDAMPDGGVLKILAKNICLSESYARKHGDARSGTYVVIRVSDTGMGIPPEKLDLIFEPFFTSKEIGRGTGIGLAVVSGVVKNHGGFIEVSSKVAQETQFQVFLPAVDAPLPETQIHEDMEGLRGKGELILVVDDETDICFVTKTTLETYGYQVIIANDGIEAVALYGHHYHEVSCILLDMMMPSLDGRATIKNLQYIDPQVKIIATSGLSMETNNPGVKTFLPKPYTPQGLLKVLYEVIELP